MVVCSCQVTNNNPLPEIMLRNIFGTIWVTRSKWVNSSRPWCIYVSVNLAIIGSGNSLLDETGLLLNGPLGTNFSAIVFIQENEFQNVVCKIATILSLPRCVNELRPRPNGWHFTDDTLKCIFLNVRIFIKISLKFVPKGPINIGSDKGLARPGNKPLSEPMMVRLLMHICVTRPQGVNTLGKNLLLAEYLSPCHYKFG